MKLSLSLAAAILATPVPPPTGGPVEIVITKVRSSEGTVHVELCPERQWLKVCPYKADASAHAGTTIIVIANVPPGRYGAQAYHDKNRDGKADRNLIGFPTEDVGFSNNALTALASPKFAVAAFDHGAGPQRITFYLRSVP
jgi:uncharacterized protein (DUF2141 family)